MGGIADIVGDGLNAITLGGFDAVTGGIGGGGTNAPRNAAQAQLQGIRESNQLQRDLFNAQSGLSSYQRGIGNQALGMLGGMYGLQGGYDPAGTTTFGPDGRVVNTPGTSPPGGSATGTGTPDYSAFLNSPDYQFALSEGNRGLDRTAAAGGNLFSGGRAREAAQYNQGMATQQLGNFQNRLASLAGIGQSSTNQLGQTLQNTGNNISQGLQGMGDARASGYLGQYQARQDSTNNLLNLAGTAAGAFALFSDRRLKSKIERIGTHPSGLPWYRYEIFGQPSEGVMADEVLMVKPEAVSTHGSGYLMVDYGAI